MKQTKSKQFEAAYRSFYEPIFQFLKNRTGDADVAADLLQETFLKVYRFLDSYQPTAAMKSWVFQIARNTLVDWWRGSLKEPQKVASHELGEDQLVCPDLQPEALLERRSQLESWLKELSGAQRKVVWLRLTQGLNDEEISRRLALSVSAVKSLLFRARQIALEPALF